MFLCSTRFVNKIEESVLKRLNHFRKKHSRIYYAPSQPQHLRMRLSPKHSMGLWNEARRIKIEKNRQGARHRFLSW
jgi:hypothetical protein